MTKIWTNVWTDRCTIYARGLLLLYLLYCFSFIGPMIDVTIEPYIITSFITPPYNSFTLNCTASVHDTILVPKTFHWRVIFGAHEMNLSSNTGSIMITDMNLNGPTSNSILRVTENISGSYQYICTAVLQFPGVEDDITGISSANVTVRGMLPEIHLNFLLFYSLILSKSCYYNCYHISTMLKNNISLQLPRLQHNLPMSQWSMCPPVLLSYSGLCVSSRTLLNNT